MFDVRKTKEECISFIKNWFNECGKDHNAVLGISGGKDSTIVAALCVEALGADRVIGVLLPNGEQSDIDDAIKVCDVLGIKKHIINIKPMVDASYEQLKASGIELTKQCVENLPPRERTKMIRAICQCEMGRMINTCNYSEDYIGYFTIGGDGEGDMSPLGLLTKTEVVELGHYLNLPKELVDKTPADGLCGKTDEDNFGFSYDVLDRYIRTGEIEDMTAKEKIDTLHQKNLFKLQSMATYKPTI